MSSGKVVEIIGAVVDVEFPRDAMPKVYDALKIESYGLTLEVTYDKKYLNGLANKPLIVIKGKPKKPNSLFRWT